MSPGFSCVVKMPEKSRTPVLAGGPSMRFSGGVPVRGARLDGETGEETSYL